MGNFLTVDNPPPEETESSANQAYATLPPTLGERLGAEAGSTTGQVAGFLGRTFAPRPESYAHLRGPQGSGQVPPEVIANSRMLDPDAANKAYAPEDNDGKPLKLFTAPVHEDDAMSIGRAKAKEIEREGILARYGNAHSTLTGLGVGAVGFMLDPIQAATAVLPGIGEEAIIAKLGTDFLSKTVARGVAGGISAGAAMAPIAALKYGIGRTEASDYDLRAAFGEVAGGALFGAVMHAGVFPAVKYAWGEGVTRLNEQGILSPAGPEIPVPFDGDIRSIIESGVNKAWDKHLGSLYGVRDLLSSDAETQRTALSAATAQVLDGRPVDISAIFPDHTDAARSVDPEAFQEMDVLTAERARAAGLLAPRETIGTAPADVAEEAGRVTPAAVGMEFASHLGMLSPEDLAAIRAYHGTPHDFDRFDMSKIGTGEGAQVFGHGLYFAENESVAKSYQISVPEAKLRGDPVAARIRSVMDTARSDDQARETLRARGDDEALARFDETVKAMRGNVYEVSIDVDHHQLLDWDKPLNQQHPDVQAKLNEILRPSDRMPEEWIKHSPGAEQRLREAGVPGIRYLDQGSRGTVEGSRNIVIFDDSLVKITHKNGEPVSAKERSDAIEAMHGKDAGDSDTPPTLAAERARFYDSIVSQAEFGDYRLEKIEGQPAAEPSFKIIGKNGEDVGQAAIVLRKSGTVGLTPLVNEAYRRKGVATALYNHIEKLAENAGRKITKSGALTEDGAAFWSARDAARGTVTGQEKPSVAARSPFSDMIGNLDSKLKGASGDEKFSLPKGDFTQQQHLFRASWDAPVAALEDLVIRGIDGEEPAAVRRAEAFTGDAKPVFDKLIADYKDIIAAYDKGDRASAVAALRNALESATSLGELQDSPVARLFTQHARSMAKTLLHDNETLSRDAAGRSQASFRSSDLMIRIAMDADNKLGLFSHEAVHALRHLDVFTPEEWSTLETAARSQGWIESQNVRERYAEAYKGRPDLEKLIVEEAIAEQYSQWRTGAKTFAPQVQTLFQKIADFFARLAEWVKGKGFQAADDASLARLRAEHPEEAIFKKIAAGEMKERFEAPIRSRVAEIDSRMAELSGRVKAAYDRAKASSRSDLPRLAAEQRELYKTGFAQGMPQDELKALMDEVYGSDNPAVAEARKASEAEQPAGAADAPKTIAALKSEEQKMGESLKDAENPATARTEADRAEAEKASAPIPPELAAEEARMQQALAEGYKPDAEEMAELAESQAALQAADVKQQAYAQAAECLIEAGI